MEPFYDNFLEALTERYPKKAELVNALMEILPLEKESIYRRLRKDIFFTSEEVMRISSIWNISLDNIICMNPNKTRPFRFNMIEYVDPQESDYYLLEDYNQTLALVGQDPESRMVEITHTIPRSLYSRYENLTRLFTMKWRYKHSMPETPMLFSDIQIPERMRTIEKEYIKRIHSISEINAIHDPRFIEHLVDDIVYFQSVKMITEKDVALLKSELLELIDYLEDTSIRGYLQDTGAKVFFYLSHTWLEGEYFLYESKYLTLSMVKILERNAVISFDQKVFLKFMEMFQSTKRSSVLLSASNSLQLIEFCAKQKEMVIALLG